jgi:molybdopterin adenylyltransferase
MKAKIALLTASDRASRGQYQDLSVDALKEALKNLLQSDYEILYRLLPDEQKTIEKELKLLADQEKCCLVLTTGGTGPAPRDVTPEATAAVCDRILPGFGEEMRRLSLQYTPTAIVSRQTAGTRGACFILNLPGKPRAARQCLEMVFGAVPDVIDLIGGPRLVVKPHVREYRH